MHIRNLSVLRGIILENSEIYDILPSPDFVDESNISWKHSEGDPTKKNVSAEIKKRAMRDEFMLSLVRTSPFVVLIVIGREWCLTLKQKYVRAGNSISSYTAADLIK